MEYKDKYLKYKKKYLDLKMKAGNLLAPRYHGNIGITFTPLTKTDELAKNISRFGLSGAKLIGATPLFVLGGLSAIAMGINGKNTTTAKIPGVQPIHFQNSLGEYDLIGFINGTTDKSNLSESVKTILRKNNRILENNNLITYKKTPIAIDNKSNFVFFDIIKNETNWRYYDNPFKPKSLRNIRHNEQLGQDVLAVLPFEKK